MDAGDLRVFEAVARLGAPQTSIYHDVVFQARTPEGAEVGLRVDPEYPRLELVACVDR